METLTMIAGVAVGAVLVILVKIHSRLESIETLLRDRLPEEPPPDD
jgi:hypothetical protein